jgi:hypothetical protein
MVLKFINEQMSAIGIPYEFYEWTSEVKYPYFVGEITENEPMTEDGKQEYSLILTGFNRGNYLELEEAKDKIKKHFHPLHGLRAKTDDNETIAVFCAGAFSIPSGEAELKKIQINLKIFVWKEV